MVNTRRFSGLFILMTEILIKIYAKPIEGLHKKLYKMTIARPNTSLPILQIVQTTVCFSLQVLCFLHITSCIYASHSVMLTQINRMVSSQLQTSTFLSSRVKVIPESSGIFLILLKPMTTLENRLLNSMIKNHDSTTQGTTKPTPLGGLKKCNGNIIC